MAEVTQLPEGPDAVEVLLRFARAGHRAGYPTAELEERLLTLARALDVRGAQISATPTLVELSVGSLPAQRSFTIRVRPPTVDLDRIAKLDGLVQDVVHGRLSAAAALAKLAEIEAHPLARPWFVRLAAYGLAGGCPGARASTACSSSSPARPSVGSTPRSTRS